MAANPLGFVQVSDLGQPEYINGTARAGLLAGQIVGVSGATGVVSSGLSSYTTSDVSFYAADDSELAVGVALGSVASGGELAVATGGVYILSCAGSVFAGRIVKAVASQHAVANLGSQAVPANAEDASIAGNIFGRALTAGASGGFAIVKVGL